MGTKKLTLKKQLMAAVAMVLVALLAIGTATFAWFTNNTDVYANGLDVKVNTPGSFLLISKEEYDSTISTQADIAKAIQAENSNKGFTTVNFAMTGDEILVNPTAHDDVTNTSDATTLSKWYTAESSSPAEYEMKSGTRENLTAFNGNVIHKRVWITLSANSEPVKDLTVSATISKADTGKTNSAARVLVTTANGVAELKDGEGTLSSTTVLSSGNITSATAIPVDIFIYMDGKDSSIYSNNYENLVNAKINLTFNTTKAS